MRNSVFIVGPSGSGKSKNAFAFVKKLELQAIQDWSMGDPILPKGMLYLTNEDITDVINVACGDGEDITVIPIEKAKNLYL